MDLKFAVKVGVLKCNPNLSAHPFLRLEQASKLFSKHDIHKGIEQYFKIEYPRAMF